MQIEGYEHTYRNFIEPGLDAASFSKALNRSVTGSINDLVFGAKLFLVGNEMTLIEVSVLLNETPMSYLNSSPREAFRSLTEEYINPDELEVETHKEYIDSSGNRPERPGGHIITKGM